jgi:hypothetical protein
LLDDQRIYFEDAARRNRRLVEFTNLWRAVATALAFKGGSGAVITSFAPENAWIAIAGILGAALAAYALDRKALRRDRSNADRSEKARNALDRFAARYDAVAAAARNGEDERWPYTLLQFASTLGARIDKGLNVQRKLRC